jgi:hypothetical protein
MAPVTIDLTRLSEEELLDLNRRVVSRLRLIRSARQFVELARFTVGMRVEFTTDEGRTMRGEVTRLNRRTATVYCDPSGHWRVSPALLRPLADSQAPPSSAARLLLVRGNRKS